MTEVDGALQRMCSHEPAARLSPGTPLEGCLESPPCAVLQCATLIFVDRCLSAAQVHKIAVLDIRLANTGEWI